MSDTLVGGILALAGTMLGFLGALAIRSLDVRRQEREAKRALVGYISTVLAEVAMNQVVLSHRVEHQVDTGELTVSDSAYRAAELALARDLSWAALDALYAVYAPIRSGLLYSWTFVHGGGLEVQSFKRIDLEACAALLPQFKRTQEVLHQERDRLKIKS
jgi:hypothetical protein